MTVLPSDRPARRIIYVDASFSTQDKVSKICLYDVDVDKIEVLQTTLPSSSSCAERYAIVFACLYAKKYNLLDKKVHILNDNLSATKHIAIQKLCERLHISISWIPREINQVADKGTQEICTTKERDVNIYDLFYELVMDKDVENVDSNHIVKEEKSLEIQKVELKKHEKNILLNALRHTKVKNKPYVSLGEMGSYLKNHNPSFSYTSLKKMLEKYPKEFTIVNQNYVKVST